VKPKTSGYDRVRGHELGGEWIEVGGSVRANKGAAAGHQCLDYLPRQHLCVLQSISFIVHLRLHPMRTERF
jgi:hypothetical protein